MDKIWHVHAATWLSWASCSDNDRVPSTLEHLAAGDYRDHGFHFPPQSPAELRLHLFQATGRLMAGGYLKLPGCEPGDVSSAHLLPTATLRGDALMAQVMVLRSAGRWRLMWCTMAGAPSPTSP